MAQTTAYFTAWADAAVALARDDGEPVHEALSRVDRAHHTRLEAGLVRAAKGRPADWSSADFWDGLAAPLVTVAHDRQLHAPQLLRYIDVDWTDAAGMSR